MTRALVDLLAALAVLAAAAPAARADDSFEARARGAEHVRALDGLVWALTAPCDQGDDTARRQCRLVRDGRVSELAGATLLVEAEAGAFAAGAWDAAKKSVPLELTGCIRCAGVEVAGKTWYVVLAGKPPHVEGDRLAADRIYDNARTFPDEASASAWTATLAGARVQLLVKVPAKPRWTAAGKDGIALELVGYRVIAPCDGSIVVASPPSGPAEPDKAHCHAAPTAAPAETGGGAPTAPPDADELTPAMVSDAMHPAVAAAQACYDTYGVAGRAKLRLTVSGEGAILKLDQQGDFVGTPTGACIERAVKDVKFPRTRKPKTSFSFPIPLP